MNYKVLMRWYLVPAQVAKFLPSYSPTCFRGCSDSGTHPHIWWSCPTVQLFWAEIFHIISTLFNCTLDPDPATAILNQKPLAVTSQQFKLLLQVTTAAKQTIAKAWKSPHLSIVETKNRITRAMIHAKVEAILVVKVKKYENLWKPWVYHYLPVDFDSTPLTSWLLTNC